MTASSLAYSDPVRLHQVGAGISRTLAPDDAQRGRIAKALDLASLDSFEADVRLEPSAGGWTLSGRVRAHAVQTCGLTLEPLPVDIDEGFSLALTESEEPRGEDDEIEITLDDESPDLIENGVVDLGQYAVEQLALQLDPFPRKPGAEFVQPAEPTEISPFAVLKALRPTNEG